jgi:hypothetical protein
MQVTRRPISRSRGFRRAPIGASASTMKNIAPTKGDADLMMTDASETR